MRVSLWMRLLEDPWGVVVRAFTKSILGPLRYGRPGGYDAAEYWGDRYRRHGLSLRGPGHEGLSEARNAEIYAEATRTLRRFCRMNGIDLSTSKVLEIGCGPGVWAEVCHSEGTADYTGLDITDVPLLTLRTKYPEYRFVAADVRAAALPGTYDIIMMIDVVEHIVDKRELGLALRHVRDALAPKGVFIVALPLAENETGPRSLFYLKLWPRSAITSCFPGYDVTSAVPFRNGEIFALRRPREDHSPVE